MRLRSLVTPLHWAVAALALATAGCGGPPTRGEEHREIRLVSARGTGEAYDALVNTLLQRFDATDAQGTSREGRTALTTWRAADEPNRLVRRRARASVTARKGHAVVFVSVERQVSAAKTANGDLDRQSPRWTGGADTPDSSLEREILLAVKARLGGEIEQ